MGRYKIQDISNSSGEGRKKPGKILPFRGKWVLLVKAETDE